MPEAAKAAGYTSVSTYQHYEDLFKKEYLPLSLVKNLIPLFGSRGVHPDSLYELAGILPKDADEKHVTHRPLKDSDTSGEDDRGSTQEEPMKLGDVVEILAQLPEDAVSRVGRVAKGELLMIRGESASRPREGRS